MSSLLADHSYEISYLIFLKLGKISKNVSSAAVVVCTLILKISTYAYTSASTQGLGIYAICE